MSTRPHASHNAAVDSDGEGAPTDPKRTRCRTCGRRPSRPRRKLTPAEAAILREYKRVWRLAVEHTETSHSELAARFGVSRQYVARCFSDEEPDAPHAIWELLAPDALRAAIRTGISALGSSADRAEGGLTALAHTGVIRAAGILQKVDAYLADKHIDPTEGADLAREGRQLRLIGVALEERGHAAMLAKGDSPC